MCQVSPAAALPVSASSMPGNMPTRTANAHHTHPEPKLDSWGCWAFSLQHQVQVGTTGMEGLSGAPLGTICCSWHTTCHIPTTKAQAMQCT